MCAFLVGPKSDERMGNIDELLNRYWVWQQHTTVWLRSVGLGLVTASFALAGMQPTLSFGLAIQALSFLFCGP